MRAIAYPACHALSLHLPAMEIGQEHMLRMTQVMELVKALTGTINSITVCATIHSPSPQTFDLFDRVIILLSGRIVYFGNNGRTPRSPHCSSAHKRTMLATAGQHHIHAQGRACDMHYECSSEEQALLSPFSGKVFLRKQ